MKEINTPIVKKKIAEAFKKIKKDKIRPPSDGYMVPILDQYTRRGKWQVELVHDTRRFKKPYLALFFFRKPYNLFSAYYYKYVPLSDAPNYI